MTRRKPRGLRPEEQQLWDKVRHGTTPLQQSKKATLQNTVQRPKPVKPTVPISRFRVGEASTAIPPRNDIVPNPRDYFSSGQVQMDHKRYGKMKRGKLTPDGRIDLHGMTTAQAHPALVRFVANAYGQGMRLILVITGKGKSKADEGPIPVRIGVLKHQVPGWLRSGQMAPLVLQVTESHMKHGGSGAYYVYLRRRR